MKSANKHRRGNTNNAMETDDETTTVASAPMDSTLGTSGLMNDGGRVSHISNNIIQQFADFNSNDTRIETVTSPHERGRHDVVRPQGHDVTDQCGENGASERDRGHLCLVGVEFVFEVSSREVVGAVGQEHGAAEVVGVAGFRGRAVGIGLIFEVVGSPDVVGVAAPEHASPRGIGGQHMAAVVLLHAQAVGVVAAKGPATDDNKACRMAEQDNACCYFPETLGKPHFGLGG